MTTKKKTEPARSLNYEAPRYSADYTAENTAALAPERGELGDIVNFVMDDGVTIRPAIIVAFIDYKTHLESNGRRVYGSYDLHVWVDGSYDNDIRGPHADATLTDFRTNIPLDPGTLDVQNPAAGKQYGARTWHFRGE